MASRLVLRGKSYARVTAVMSGPTELLIPRASKAQAAFDQNAAALTGDIPVARRTMARPTSLEAIALLPLSAGRARAVATSVKASTLRCFLSSHKTPTRHTVCW